MGDLYPENQQGLSLEDVLGHYVPLWTCIEVMDLADCFYNKGHQEFLIQANPEDLYIDQGGNDVSLSCLGLDLDLQGVEPIIGFLSY